MHQPEKAAVVQKEENAPSQVACPSPQMKSDTCPQPMNLAEVRTCYRCICAGFVPVASSEIRLPDLTEMPQIIQFFGVNEMVFILSKLQLHIQVSQMFHHLIYFLSSPGVSNCQADAGMVLGTCTH